MKIRRRNGIEIEGDARILIDPRRTEKGITALISHGHLDHVPADLGRPRSTLISTHTTKRVLTRRFGASRSSTVGVDFKEEFEVAGFRIKPLIAGHVPGSAMFLLEGEGLKILYTGDVNPKGGFAVEGPAKIPKADVLIIEATYGKPMFRFPGQDRVRAELVNWAVNSSIGGRTPVFAVYPLGKAQEVIATLIRMTDLRIYATKEVERVNEACRQVLDLPCSVVEGEPDGPAAVVSGLSRTPRLRNVVKAIATGWAVAYRSASVDRAFPLSSHADFDDLISIIDDSQAERIFTVFGFEDELANYVRWEMGREANPLDGRWAEI